MTRPDGEKWSVEFHVRPTPAANGYVVVMRRIQEARPRVHCSHAADLLAIAPEVKPPPGGGHPVPTVGGPLAKQCFQLAPGDPHRRRVAVIRGPNGAVLGSVARPPPALEPDLVAAQLSHVQVLPSRSGN